MNYEYSKLKDPLVSYILNFSNKLSQDDMRNITYGIFIIPIFSSLILSFVISNKTVYILICTLIFSLAMIVYSLKILIRILVKDTGNERMIEIADAIREGSEGFFITQYSAIFKLSLLFGVIIFLFYFGRSLTGHEKDYLTETLGQSTIAFLIVLSFFLGAFCSAFAGYSGMWVSVRANIRVASAAMRCYNDALVTCFEGGLFGSIINISLALLGISFNFLFIYFLLYLNTTSHEQIQYDKIPLLLIGFSFGASFVAMFAQLGGGIYTKAADVGADLIGKIEMGIEEDDARNPAVIADLVGDNVGDCAGQAADLFESISAEILSAMILGSALSEKINIDSMDLKSGFICFPLIIHCLDLLVSVIGAMFVKTKPGLPIGGSEYQDIEDPMNVMLRGYKVSVTLGVIGIFIICYFYLNIDVTTKVIEGGLLTRKSSHYAWLYYSICAIIGLADSYLLISITQYYTDYNYPHVKSIALSSQTGHATNIITGLSVGLQSTILPTLLISVSLILTYNLGCASNLIEGEANLAGLYGTAVATMGMFVSGVFILSMSGFGPIADNAGGIIEMSLSDHSVRIITDRLDAVGNITKANTKGYSVGSASLACFLLFSAFMDEIEILTGDKNGEFRVIDIGIVEVFISGLLGSAVVFLFSSFALSAVGNAAQAVIKEVRAQIKEDENILSGKTKPNYKQCVAIVTKAGLKEMIKPGLLAVLSPMVIGVVFKYVGYLKNEPYLSVKCVSSFLMFATTTGILMALFFNNSGGAWDNAKKYIETGALGGKGSDCHKAAVTGDTVGDPFKDTAGPSIHILIKLIATISLVLAPLFI